MSARGILAFTMLLVASLLAGCGSTPYDIGAQNDVDAQTRTIPELGVHPTPGSLDLVILHTNDNWGETEPCG